MKIGIDKYYHFGVGCVIALVIAFITSSIIGALFVTAFIGVAKEFRDEFVYGGFSIADIIATILGGILGVLIYLTF